MTAILGISAFYHDSAAALIVDGNIVAAAQEERFTRKKHDPAFPQNAVDFCLQEAGISPKKLDYVAFYDKPLNKFERLLETYLAYAPLGYRSFRRSMPLWLKQKLHLPREMSRRLRGEYSGRFVFADHHESHAASAFFPSPFAEAALLTLDGVGEWATTCYGVGRENKIQLLREIRFPHSLGLLYSAFTYYAGFRVNSGEYKLMGLAPYGRPTYQRQIQSKLMDLKEDGSFRMDMSYFNYCQGLTMTSSRFHALFDGPPRKPESPITQRDADIAASIQATTEEVMLRIARHVHKKTGMKNLALAGGVALNCVGNGRIQREGPFDQVWIQPAAGDAGGALGAALFVWHQLLENNRRPQRPDGQAASLLGPSFSEETIRQTLREKDAVFTTCPSNAELCDQAARLLAEENVVGWFQGRMEFGPRALGSRSIFGDPRSEKMQSTMNLKIKFRESFRPFAPIVLQERAADYFEMRETDESPYMLLTAPLRKSRRRPPPNNGQTIPWPEKLRHRRSEIPAVTHVDYSARVQTADSLRNPLLCQLLKAFQRRTGCPVLINTSFNIRSEPIVCSPEDAWRCFMMTDMDALVLGRCLLRKKEQPHQISPAERQKHLAQFELD